MERNPEIRQMLNNPEVLRQVQKSNNLACAQSAISCKLLDDGNCEKPVEAARDDQDDGPADAES